VESLDSRTDEHDVYRLTLKAGDTLTAWLTVQGSGLFEMSLYSPAASSVFDTDEILDSSRDTVSYTVGDDGAGTYYLDIAAQLGSGQYRVDWIIDPAAGSSDGSDGDEEGGDGGAADFGGGGSNAGTVRALASSLWRNQHILELDGTPEAPAEEASGTSAPVADSAQAQSLTGSGTAGSLQKRSRAFEPFTIALVAVALFAALGIWRTRVRVTTRRR
jgi:hypothetical protein